MLRETQLCFAESTTTVLFPSLTTPSLTILILHFLSFPNVCRLSPTCIFTKLQDLNPYGKMKIISSYFLIDLFVSTWQCSYNFLFFSEIHCILKTKHHSLFNFRCWKLFFSRESRNKFHRTHLPRNKTDRTCSYLFHSTNLIQYYYFCVKLHVDTHSSYIIIPVAHLTVKVWWAINATYSRKLYMQSRFKFYLRCALMRENPKCIYSINMRARK